GLAGAVGSDQGAALALRNLKRDAVDRAQAAEHLGEIADFDRGAHGGPPSGSRRLRRIRLKNPTMPSGAHRIVAMKMMPMTAVWNSKKLETQLRSPSTMPEPRKGPMI